MSGRYETAGPRGARIPEVDLLSRANRLKELQSELEQARQALRGRRQRDSRNWHLEPKLTQEEEPWLTTYLDMMTLLLVLMLVMLAYSGAGSGLIKASPFAARSADMPVALFGLDAPPRHPEWTSLIPLPAHIDVPAPSISPITQVAEMPTDAMGDASIVDKTDDSVAVAGVQDGMTVVEIEDGHPRGDDPAALTSVAKVDTEETVDAHSMAERYAEDGLHATVPAELDADSAADATRAALVETDETLDGTSVAMVDADAALGATSVAHADAEVIEDAIRVAKPGTDATAGATSSESNVEAAANTGEGGQGMDGVGKEDLTHTAGDNSGEAELAHTARDENTLSQSEGTVSVLNSDDPTGAPVSDKLDIATSPQENATQSDPEAATTTDSDEPGGPQASDLLAGLPLDTLGENIDIIVNEKSVSFRINSEILFESAQADLSLPGLAVLQRLVGVLRDVEHNLTVEGHTDSLPIRSSRYPSNWELSGARAGSVVRYLQANGIDSKRLRAIGYADTRPLADNSTSAGRASNRRVELIMERPGSDQAP